MDASIISALAALTGVAVGGLTSGIANWLNHRSHVRAGNVGFIVLERINIALGGFRDEIPVEDLPAALLVKQPLGAVWSVFTRS